MCTACFLTSPLTWEMKVDYSKADAENNVYWQDPLWGILSLFNFLQTFLSADCVPGEEHWERNFFNSDSSNFFQRKIHKIPLCSVVSLLMEFWLFFSSYRIKARVFSLALGVLSCLLSYYSYCVLLIYNTNYSGKYRSKRSNHGGSVLSLYQANLGVLFLKHRHFLAVLSKTTLWTFCMEEIESFIPAPDTVAYALRNTRMTRVFL